MEQKAQQPLSQRIKITLIVLGVLLVVLFVLLVRDYLALRRTDAINRRELSLSAFVQKNGPLNASEVGAIRSWMTFDYINKIFALPKDYLKDQLHISDPRYPNIALSSYASENKIATTEAVNDIEGAIVHYFNQPAF
jgi:hypothetical protein